MGGSTYLDFKLSNHASFKRKWKIVLLEDLIDLFWPKNEILEEDVSAEEAHVKLLLIEAEE